LVSFFDPKILNSLKLNSIGLATKLLKPLYLILFARLLGIDAFGVYVLLVVIFELLSKITIAGTGGGIVHLLDDIPKSLHAYRTMLILLVSVGVFLWSLCLSIGLYFIFPYIFGQILDKPELIEYAHVYLPFLALFSIQNVYLNSLRNTLDLKYELWVENLLVPFLILTLGLVLGRLYGLQGVLASHLIAYGISAGILMYIVISQYGRLQWSRTVLGQVQWHKFVKDSLYHVGYRGLNLLKHHLDTLMVGYFLSTRSVAIYSVALEISSLIRKVRMGFESILMPYIKKVNIDSKQYAAELKNIMLWMGLASLALSVVLVFYATFWFAVFGSDFTSQTDILFPLILSQFFFVILGVLETAMYMYGRGDIAMIQNTLMLAINGILTFIGIKYYGLLGAACATCLASFIVGLITVWKHFKLTGIQPYGRPLALATCIIFLVMGIFHYNVFSLSSYAKAMCMIICLAILYMFYRKNYFTNKHS